MISPDGVAKHNMDKDRWATAHDHIREVARPLVDHSGGAKPILPCWGKGATEKFDLFRANEVFKKYGLETRTAAHKNKLQRCRFSLERQRRHEQTHTHTQACADSGARTQTCALAGCGRPANAHLPPIAWPARASSRRGREAIHHQGGGVCSQGGGVGGLR